MRAVVQRVLNAQVDVDGKKVSSVERGFLTLLGVAKGDTEAAATKLIEKVSNLRVFEDEAGKMNKSLLEIGGENLIVSQFTLLADCSQGRRPSFIEAETPERAKALYEFILETSRKLGVKTGEGVFQADMKISLVNDGPATFILEF